ncbi:hypothetical protein [Enterococcus devriesei]|uniref:hypothetical protein n=1 Tax=Enterococcus devriesei TaxID=319970 RepID=UPI0036D3F5E1
MGQRCYLTTDTIQIFESTNHLPTFWLLGLGEEQLQALAQQLETYELAKKLSQPELVRRLEEKQFGVIKTKMNDFQNNLIDREEYISTLYPELLDLYEDFQRVIMEESTHAPTIELIYLDYLFFFENSAELLTELEELFLAITYSEETAWIDAQDILGTTIGSDRFSNHQGELLHDHYEPAEINRPSAKTHPASADPQLPKRQLLSQCIKSSLLLILSLVLTLGSIFMIRYPIPRPAGITGILLFGLGTIIFSGQLRSDLLLLKKIKKLND